MWFVRNQNQIGSKSVTQTKNGVYEFNERVEMQTMIEYDQNKQQHKPKTAYLMLKVGNENIAKIEINLADFLNPIKTINKFMLSNDGSPAQSADEGQDYLMLEGKTSGLENKGSK